MKRIIQNVLLIGLSPLIVFTFSPQTFAQSKKTMILTFKDAIYLALRNNPDLESAELERVIQKYVLVVAKNAFEPQYGLEASYDRGWQTINNATTDVRTKTISRSTNIQPTVTLNNHYGTTFTLAGENPRGRQYYNPSLTMTVEQPLIQGFGKAVVDATLNDAIDTETSNKIALKQSTIATINTVMSDYLNLIQSKKQLAINQETLQSNKRLVANDIIQIKAGQTAPADIYQDQAQVAASKSTIESDKNTLQQEKYTLLTDLGLSSDANIDLPDNVNLTSINKLLLGKSKLVSSAVAKKLIIANSPQYQIDGIALRSLRRTVITAKDALNWKLDLTASETAGAGSDGGQNKGFASLSNHRNHVEDVGLKLTIPIDDVSSKQGLIDARIFLEKAQIAFENEKRTLEIDALNDINTVTQDKATIALDQEYVDLQKKTLNTANLKKQAGQISGFEVIQYQQNLTSAQTNLISSTISYLNALQQLDLDLGITLDLLNIKIRY